MNYSDSARIKAILLNCGFSYTENLSDADIVIFDTCSVRQKSEDKITGKLKEISPKQKIWITGCMIQHNLRNSKISKNSKLKIGNFMGSLQSTNPEIIGITTQEINNLPNKILQSGNIVGINHSFNPLFHTLTQKRKNIELFFRIDDVGFLPLILPKIGYKINYDSEILNEYDKIIPQGINTSMNKHNSTAYVPISTGCSQFCAYCIVPYARGLEKNFSVEQIVKEATLHVQKGAKEIVLLGQIVNKHPDFIQIIKEVSKIQGLQRLRYTSPYPTYYSKELLELHQSEPKLCPHIHIPLQSGSDQILKKMFRGYTSQQFKTFIKNIRDLSRPISITTDIIVGFPGETDQDFQETLDLVQYAQFDMIYMGIYSTRPGTIAQRKYPDTIPYQIKHQRRSQLNNILKQISLENNQKEIGSIKEVLINEIIPNGNTETLKHGNMKGNGIPQGGTETLEQGNIIGYTDNMKQIILTNPQNRKFKKGDILKTNISNGKTFKLYGEIL